MIFVFGFLSYFLATLIHSYRLAWLSDILGISGLAMMLGSLLFTAWRYLP
jgi:hypothetical protein